MSVSGRLGHLRIALRRAKWVDGIMDGFKINKNNSRLYSETVQLI